MIPYKTKALADESRKDFREEEAPLIEGFTPEGYYVAFINGVWITFVSYDEYLDYQSE